MPANSPAFDPDTPNLAPDEFVEVSRAMASSTRLLLLDQFWTREAKRASTSATRDSARVQALTGVIEEMDQLLKDCSDLAPTVATIAKRADTNLQARYEALVAGSAIDGSEAPRRAKTLKLLRHHVETGSNGDAVAHLVKATELVRTRAEPQAQELRQELAKIQESNSDGDMDEQTQEAVATLALGAGLLLGPEAAGAVIVVAEIIDCLT